MKEVGASESNLHLKEAKGNFEAIIDGLGPPYFQTDQVILYKGDSVHLLERLRPGVVDLVVTSPPYNIGKEYEDPLPLNDYLNWCGSWMKLLHSATTDEGAFWLNLGYLGVPGVGKAVPLPYLLGQRCPCHLIQEVVWNYGAGVAARRSFSPRNEKFLWYVKDEENYYFDLDSVRDPDVKYPNQKKNGKLKCNPMGKNPTDVWNFPKVTSGKDRSSKERTDHPAQFPKAVVERIVRACSATDGLLLDPFVGSGTVAEVALQTGRYAVGIDINEKYLEVAAQRCQAAIQQGIQEPLAAVEG